MPLAQNSPASRIAQTSACRRLRVGAAVAAAALCATLVAGCDTPRVADEFHPRLTDPARRHPITVVAETATLDVAIGQLPKGSEARAYVETTRFIRRYGNEGRGDLTVSVPRASSHRASSRLGQIRLAAHQAGIPHQRIRVAYVAGRHDVITMSYDRIAAVGPTCGDWSSELSHDREKLPYPNWGCASQRNLAAMTANPTDLMFPANEGPRGSETRAQDVKTFNQNIGKAIQAPSSK